MSERLPTVFISHGGGPWPFMAIEPPGAYDGLAAWLRAMPDAVGIRDLDRFHHSRSWGILPGMDRHFESRLPGFPHRLDEVTNWMGGFAICEINAQDVLLLTDCPIHGANAGFGSHTARRDGDQANRHVKLAFSALPGVQDSFQSLIPIQVVAVKSPVRREAHLKKFNILPGGILKQFPGNPLDNL